MPAKVKVDRDQLLGRIQSVRVGLADRETIDQAKCVVFLGGRVMTYNEDIACRVESGLGDAVKGAVGAAKLIEILEKLPDDVIELEQIGGELIVSGKRKKSGLTMEAEVHLPIDDVPEPDDWRALPAEFEEAVGLVARCAGRNENRFSLTCVHFHADYIEACDNAQMMRYRMNLDIDGEFLLKGTALKAAAALGITEYSTSESWTHFRNNSGLVMSCRRYVDEYYDMTNSIEFDGEPVELPKGLAEAVDRCAVFSSENADSNKVVVELRPGKVRVKGRGLTGWHQEVRDVKYSGPEFSFTMSPDILCDVIRRYPEAILGEDKLKVEGGVFVYVASLSPADAA